MKNISKTDTISLSKKDLLAIKDAQEALKGSWKILILICLLCEAKRFRQIANTVDGISDKMLSKELKELERNKLIQRKVLDTYPPVVEYSITRHALSLHDLIVTLKEWGYLHRKAVIGK